MIFSAKKHFQMAQIAVKILLSHTFSTDIWMVTAGHKWSQLVTKGLPSSF